MTLRDLRRALTQGRRVLFPTSLRLVLERTPEWREVEEEWLSQKQAFGLQTEDADILQLGCGDGRLLFLLLGGDHPARRATGIRTLIGSKTLINWPMEDRLGRIQIHDEIAYLDAFDPASFDLIICDDLENVFCLDGLEDRLDRLYSLLRPGGEAVLTVQCANTTGTGGFGVLTASSWIMMFMRAGFEPANVMRLPTAVDREAMEQTTGDAQSLRLHLLRPWEAWELERLRTTDEAVDASASKKTKKKA
ncbi:hypothetical protein [Brevundimonas sp. Leaf168]|uniref:hypothetical protein n=1 Tax=Brevundimonas sp. Leaf168 TaxID=1736283 RepID=UPI0006F52D94|nr:hypothetical protein [Brevundimonas sp. Leaf168]KQR56242.1 hypothetical protein ASF81_07210 [Brevundimonas sp. Leaf168]